MTQPPRHALPAPPDLPSSRASRALPALPARAFGDPVAPEPSGATRVRRGATRALPPADERVWTPRSLPRTPPARSAQTPPLIQPARAAGGATKGPRHAVAPQPKRAQPAAPRRGRAPEVKESRRRHIPIAAATFAAGLVATAVVVASLQPGTVAAVATPQHTRTAGTAVAGAASGDIVTVTTSYAAGAFAAPQTGGVRLTPSVKGPLSGKVIALDPGHNGGFRSSINNRSYYTFGAGWRPCAAYGTTTFTNVPEHTIVWQLANKMVPMLLDQGATVVLTRADDTGYGPCNNERPEIANREGASLFLSLHVDGNDTKTLRGFHITWSSRMAGGPALQTASQKAAAILRETILAETSQPQSNYMQTNGISIISRTDLSVLDGIRVAPALLLETGNSRNPEDVAYLTSDAGQLELAKALVSAVGKIVTSLPANPSAGPASASPSAPPGASTPPVSATPQAWDAPPPITNDEAGPETAPSAEPTGQTPLPTAARPTPTASP